MCYKTSLVDVWLVLGARTDTVFAMAQPQLAWVVRCSAEYTDLAIAPVPHTETYMSALCIMLAAFAMVRPAVGKSMCCAQTWYRPDTLARHAQRHDVLYCAFRLPNKASDDLS